MKRFVRCWLLTLSGLTIFLTITAEAFVLNNDTRNYDQQHLKLDLRFDFEQESVSGTATLKVLPLENNFRELILHSKTTTVDWVKLKHQKVDFIKSSELLRIHLNRPYHQNEPVEVTIHYTARPTQGLFFFYPTAEHPEIPYQIWSQGQGENNRYWFPCFDMPGDKMTAEILATVPANFRAISNGRLVDVIDHPRKDEKTFHWKMDYPQVSYLISIVVGEFYSVSDTVRGVPLYYNIPMNQPEARVNLIFGRTADMFTFFSDYICPYPYEKYDQTPVHDFKHGGMENVTATTLNTRILHDERAIPNYSPEKLIAHEFVHQWFGDLLTVKRWPHFWLHEAFATYFTDLYFERRYGRDEFLIRRMEQNREYLAARNDFPLDQIIPTENPFIPVDFHGYFAYTRGAAILHNLRCMLGDAIFQRGIQKYVEKFKFGEVVSEDFRAEMEAVAGRDLSQFFRQWIYGAGHPHFKVAWQWNDSLKIVTLTIQQIQSEAPTMNLFHLEVPVEITAGKQRILVRVPISRREQAFQYHLAESPQMVRFDKGHWILKEIDFPKSLTELRYQLQYDSDVTGRYLAAEQLRGKGEAAIPVLKRALAREPNYAVRMAVVKSLGQISGEKALDALKLAAQDNDARVRTEVMTVLATFPATSVQPILKAHFENETNDYVRGAALASLGKVNAENAFEILKKALLLDSHRNVIRTGAFEGFLALKDARALPLAQEYTQYKYSSGGLHLLEKATLNFAREMLPDHREAALAVFLEGLKNPFFRTHQQAAQLLIEAKATEVLPQLHAALKTLKRRSVRQNCENVIEKLSGK